MSESGKVTRRRAVEMMTAVTADGRLLAEVMPKALADLAPAERARAGRLATEGLRFAQRSDRVLGPYLRNKPEDPVMNVLRLAVYELLEVGAAPHGVVNDAVALTTRSKAGLVNAVLRNVLRSEVEWKDLPVPSLSKWLRKRLVAAWGKKAVAAIEAVVTSAPPLDLTPRGDGAAVAAAVGGTLLPTGSIRIQSGTQVSSLSGFDTGDWWVQDAAAALPAKLLDVQTGERVLDLCAAPGGKTMQLAGAGAQVTALDVSDGRLERLRENLKRTGLSADIVVADALEWTPEAPLDAILLDAPCSATGTLRRHPDLQFAKTGEEIAPLTDLQDKLLARALEWLKPGGRLVFCTCSLLPEEGEERIKALQSARPDLSIKQPDVPWIDSRWRTEMGLRIRPDHWAERGGIDGFFITLVEKPV